MKAKKPQSDPMNHSRHATAKELTANLDKTLTELIESMAGTLEIMLKTLHALEKQTRQNEQDAVRCMCSIKDLLQRTLDHLEKQAAQPRKYVL